MLNVTVSTETTLNLISSLKQEIALNSRYFDDEAMQKLINEAISYYSYAGWCKKMFIDNQIHCLKYYVSKAEAECLAPKFFSLVELLRKDSGMFLF